MTPLPPPPPPNKPPENQILWSDLDWMIPPPTKTPAPKWRQCKLLGTKLGTEGDIKSRKLKAWEPIKKHSKIFKSKRISLAIKMRTFNTYVDPIVVYNSETWSMTAKQEEEIDIHQRKLMRSAINEKCHISEDGGKTLYRNISNEKLYKITKATKWSQKIKKRRLNLLGHILRLDDTTPVKTALRESAKEAKRPIGHPPTTWIRTIMKDIAPTRKEHNITNKYNMDTLNKITKLASDRATWTGEIVRSMGDKSL